MSTSTETLDAPAPAPAARPLTPPSEPRSSTASTPAARRTPQRRAPAITINYAYLRHDLRLLAVLAPMMVVLLVVAFAVLHNA